MTKPESPCKGCENRSMLCHSDCEAYLKFKVDLEAYNEMIAEAKRKISSESSSHRAIRYAYMRRKSKGGY